ncbi:hypothetical protein SS21_23545 [Enterobacter roggenkampii]|uniref:DUF7940 domain-containing protein n=1 Tax=Enterobacteriaceae TaxID=543 RepID=UPI0005EE2D1B|nr:MULTISPECIES: hypothetical protein [Enterobacteriaceae]HBX6085249.1 hypothetical protein [Klebsiella pneumoniae]KJM84241.1 hypothetical protein SS21_23545 [Enterobacter roggenkampii]KJN51159.1 hypothetical protein SS51_23720 [Enterobacter roggenkampii]MDH1969522.1 hypothetical protein [Klebsiella michiganensis]WIJ47638.1 hypothetical protein OI984_15090 [Enterobacter roggenkampii]
MKLVDDWKSAWRWFSMHALVLAGIIPTVWAELPPDLKTAIPPGSMGAITAVIAACGVVGRLVNQSKTQ